MNEMTGKSQKTAQKTRQDQQLNAGRNVAIVEGEVSSEPLLRELPSGDVLVAFDVRVRQQDESAQSLPVTWIGSDATNVRVEKGRWVMVLGHVHRRFYQSGAGLQSRVDVRADRIVTDGPVKRSLATDRFLRKHGLNQRS